MKQEDILAEIKRTAKENGGKPLGVARFETATGIRPYDWQRYWARFTDLQREAGFSPNEMVSAYSKDSKIEQFADLIHELQKYPSKPELRHKRISDPGFPSSTTYEHLGNKQTLVRMVLDWCEDKPRYKDVVELMHPLLNSSDDADEHAHSNNVRYGFVYLVKGHPGEYKIGRTNLVDRRLSQLGVVSPVEQELVSEIKTDDPVGVEAYWHARFADKRMKGEWFKLKAEDVNAFKRWRKII